MECWDLEDHEVCNCLLKTISADSPWHPSGICPDPPGESRCSVLSPLETYQSSLLGKNYPGKAT
eukprot:556616-Pyramimonas_sp.AAC.1